MRMGPTILGLLLLAVGIVWALQGANLLGGSFMTGESLWLWIGVGCVIAGIGVLAWAHWPGAR